jgi:hypothetical protein
VRAVRISIGVECCFTGTGLLATIAVLQYRVRYTKRVVRVVLRRHAQKSLPPKYWASYSNSEWAAKLESLKLHFPGSNPTKSYM